MDWTSYYHAVGVGSVAFLLLGLFSMAGEDAEKFFFGMLFRFSVCAFFLLLPGPIIFAMWLVEHWIMTLIVSLLIISYIVYQNNYKITIERRMPEKPDPIEKDEECLDTM